MRNKTKQDFYLYYQLEDTNYNFLTAIRSCKSPRKTKEYKRLQNWLNMDLVKSCGWCTFEYFEDHKERFVPNYGQVYLNKLKK